MGLRALISLLRRLWEGKWPLGGRGGGRGLRSLGSTDSSSSSSSGSSDGSSSSSSKSSKPRLFLNLFFLLMVVDDAGMAVLVVG